MTKALVAQFEKRFTGETVIRAELSHQVDGFSVMVLFGPSGCGKTTVLRCLAGLERPQQGSIQFGETTWFDHEKRVFLRPQQRELGFLFQEYALFPHLNVVQNIGYGLRRFPRSQRRQRVSDMLDLFDLHGLQQRYPHQVSGGQQQRVALARVVACRPRLLLLDEPLSALDTSLRERLRTELRRLLSQCGTPTIIVTHDRTEAVAFADQVSILHDGTVKQVGTPDEVFRCPNDLAVAEIVGIETIVPAIVRSEENGLTRIEINGRPLLAIASRLSCLHALACIRAEDVVLQKRETESTFSQNRLDGTVISIVPEGPLVRVTLDCGFTLMALVTRPVCQELDLQIGERVISLIKASAIHLLSRT